MYILSMVILIFFAIIGLCTFISSVLDAAYRSKDGLTLIVDELTPENAEMRIRSAARICLRHRNIRMICQCGTDNSAKEICELLKTEFPFIEIRNGS